ncbi:hypothetical protein CQW39_34645 [Streptomyces griseofuscus]|uniref:Uncharacterized protein n=1 Tax=Streptomyces griseofuscus TaxID=146922 RepID=A0A3R8WMK7_9ACTN|nr:STAS domain-containing protein [Streptomyces griseofuscus]RRQ70135.1 hypothetical protein CQW39_34645 [Streptomyces griseofuscus]RRQ78993.1 hypothetical protein CQW44_35450 [Streptomyces griseofuscus]
MSITTTLDGTSARIAWRGDVDFDTVPVLRAAADALPADVADLLWDLKDAPFMDVTGLHFLFAHAQARGRSRRTTVTGLRQQPLRLLLLAVDLDPAAFDSPGLPPESRSAPDSC